jgi:uncharacterized membrane protein YvbJ
MFCQNCGNEVDDNAVVCIKCGAQVKELEAKPTDKAVDPAYAESKTIIGVLLALFLGIIGLLIGFLIYPEGTIARKTFIKSWLITYLVEIALIVLSFIIIVAVTASTSLTTVTTTPTSCLIF